MLRKFAAMAALCLPTFAQAEIVELSCREVNRPNDDPVTLRIDTSSGRVRYGLWEWSVGSTWTDELILWAALGVNRLYDEPQIGSFIFKRQTGELTIRTLSDLNFYEAPSWMENNMYNVKNCVRPF